MLTCTACGKKIKNELIAIVVSGDGDFVCDPKCEETFKTNLQEFVDNIDNDKWYEKNYPELQLKNYPSY